MLVLAFDQARTGRSVTRHKFKHDIYGFNGSIAMLYVTQTITAALSQSAHTPEAPGLPGRCYSGPKVLLPQTAAGAAAGPGAQRAGALQSAETAHTSSDLLDSAVNEVE